MRVFVLTAVVAVTFPTSFRKSAHNASAFCFCCTSDSNSLDDLVVKSCVTVDEFSSFCAVTSVRSPANLIPSLCFLHSNRILKTIWYLSIHIESIWTVKLNTIASNKKKHFRWHDVCSCNILGWKFLINLAQQKKTLLELSNSWSAILMSQAVILIYQLYWRSDVWHSSSFSPPFSAPYCLLTCTIAVLTMFFVHLLWKISHKRPPF